MKKALITGITGQDGAYLSQLLLSKGYAVFGLTRQTAPDLSRLAYLGIQKKVAVTTCDMLETKKLAETICQIQPDEIYNLAGQSSVNMSFTDPEETLRFNTLSVLNLLETVRTSLPQAKVYQASTSEIYGNKTAMPITEDSVIDPSNPYGVSKATGYLMARNYRETFGLFVANGILFNHESHLRAPHYFMRKLIITAINISKGKNERVYLGQADNARDFGYSPRYVEAMWLALQAEKASDHVICSGKPVSIRSIAEYVLGKFDIPLDRIEIDPKLFRTPNVPTVYGDPSRAKKELGWKYDMTFYEVLDILIKEETQAYGKNL